MKEFSISMSLVDLIPVFMFGISSILMQKDYYNKMPKGCYALLAAGSIDVFIAGLGKALYKLLYALGICDFEPLDSMFFPVESLGFLLEGMSLVAMVVILSRKSKKDKKAYSVAAAPMVWRGVPMFVTFMIIGTGCIFASLAIISARLKKKGLAVLMVIAFICYLAMGYLSTKDFSSASMNWFAEGINILGQSGMLLAVYIHHKAGFGEMKEFPERESA
ncbi:MAG: hypothetical protein K6E85_08165 [Lachnospiraceae bacterium]|nr:hypothetical protein [Lachnospiraceae bacterium]